MYKNKSATKLAQMPRLARTAKGGDATVAVIAATHGPGAVRIDVRDAGCQQPRSPSDCTPHSLSGRQVYHMTRLPTGVRANRAACEKLSQLKEVNNTPVERTTLELHWQLCETAVYASLAPAQPPPPAGLASSLLVG